MAIPFQKTRSSFAQAELELFVVYGKHLFSLYHSQQSLTTPLHFGASSLSLFFTIVYSPWNTDPKIVQAQVRALVHLGANACIIGRNVSKTENMAKDIATARQGAKVIGIGGLDVRSIDSIKTAVDRCVKELGGIDYVM